MEFLLVWIGLSFIAGFIASGKGRSWFGFFLLALILSPLIGVIAALVAGGNTKNIENKVIVDGEGKRCPYCAEVIKKEALICRYCSKEQ